MNRFDSKTDRRPDVLITDFFFSFKVMKQTGIEKLQECYSEKHLSQQPKHATQTPFFSVVFILLSTCQALVTTLDLGAGGNQTHSFFLLITGRKPGVSRLIF